MKRLFAVATILLIGACATAVGTPYAPANRQGYGYVSTKIEGDRFRVSFAGDGATPADVVEDYALLRAAELAVENGYDWFRIVGRSLDEDEKGGVGLGAGVGGGGRNVGVRVGGNLGTVGAKKFYTSKLEILCGKGEKPDAATGGEIYDARSLIDAIRARMPEPAE